MKNLIFIIFISCSLLEKISQEKQPKKITLEKKDRIKKHHNLVFDDLIKDPVIKKLSASQTRYLRKVTNMIFQSYPEFFKNKIRPELNFYLIKTKKPIYLSSPDGKIFFSEGLLRKYVENESQLKSFLTYELIRIEKNIYSLKTLIPKGSYSLNDIVSLSRLPVQEKIKLHQWAYHIREKLNKDGDNYLIWLKVQNRNFIDFEFFIGDKYTIFMEEQGLREFVVKNYNKRDELISNTESSKEFYSLKRGLL